MLDIFLYLLVGSIAGFLAGLLGIGGGVIIVPALALLFSHLGMPPHAIMHMAASTSLAAVMFTTLMAVIAQQRRGAIRWDMFYQLAPGIVGGAIVGTVIAGFLPTQTLKILFGLFVIVIALQMFKSRREHTEIIKQPHAVIQFCCGFLMGGLAGILGIGGGILAVPVLTRLGLPVLNAIATSSACALLLSIVATLSFMVTGQHLTGLPPGSIGYVYWPAALIIAAAGFLIVPLGTRLAHRLPGHALKRAFAVLLMLVGIKMLC